MLRVLNERTVAFFWGFRDLGSIGRMWICTKDEDRILLVATKSECTAMEALGTLRTSGGEDWEDPWYSDYRIYDKDKWRCESIASWSRCHVRWWPDLKPPLCFAQYRLLYLLIRGPLDSNSVLGSLITLSQKLSTLWLIFDQVFLHFFSLFAPCSPRLTITTTIYSVAKRHIQLPRLRRRPSNLLQRTTTIGDKISNTIDSSPNFLLIITNLHVSQSATASSA